MGYKKLISPEFKISTEHYEITRGCEVECFSSGGSKVRLVQGGTCNTV